jgi:TldD protein
MVQGPGSHRSQLPRPDASQVEELIEELRAAGVRYGEVRAVTQRRQSVTLSNGQVDALDDSEDRGAGVRVLLGKGWGFASAPGGAMDEWRAAARRAVETARAADRVDGAAVRLAELPPQRGHVPASYCVDPFEVPLEEKLSLLDSASAVMREHPRVYLGRGTLSFRRVDKVLGTTDGTLVSWQEMVSGGGVAAFARKDDLVQRRSAPKEWEGDHRRAGWEFVQSLDLVRAAGKARDEAVALLDAPLCPAETTDLVVGGPQLALQVHESVGHPLELDRVLGTEISLAGASVARTELMRAGFRYGSEHVNLVADSLVPGGMGTIPWDDEGVPARRTDLVRDGVLVGYLSGREYAAEAGISASSGAMRADSWERPPLVRMVNVNLEPGRLSWDELLGGVDRGLFVDTNRSWSIDDLRLNFHFGCEVAWEIRGGRLTGNLFRNPSYTGVTPYFWRSCDGIADGSQWRIWGFLFCGKGDPMQIMHVGHGVAPARFRSVSVAPLA